MTTLRNGSRIVTRRSQPRRPLSPIERLRYRWCAGCGKPIDARREAELPVRDGERGWHAACYVASHPVAAASGRDRRGALYAEE